MEAHVAAHLHARLPAIRSKRPLECLRRHADFADAGGRVGGSSHEGYLTDVCLGDDASARYGVDRAGFVVASVLRAADVAVPVDALRRGLVDAAGNVPARARVLAADHADPLDVRHARAHAPTLVAEVDRAGARVALLVLLHPAAERLAHPSSGSIEVKVRVELLRHVIEVVDCRPENAEGAAGERLGSRVTAKVRQSLYDALDRQVSLEVGVGSPSSLLTTYAHDPGGRVIESDDGFTCTRQTFDYRDLAATTTTGLEGDGCAAGTEQRTLTHTHDGLGRLVKTEVTAGTGLGDLVVSDGYDAVGNRLTSATVRAGVTQSTNSTFNRLDQTTAEVRSDGSLTKALYDAAGNASDRCFWRSGDGDVCLPVGSTWPVDEPDQVTTSAYDARNQRISLRNGATDGETVYDPDHNYQIKAIYTPTAAGRELQTLYSYDARHRLGAIGADDPAITIQVCAAGADHVCTDAPVLVGQDTYAYDANDNRTRVKEFNGAATSDRYYCYDALDQVVFRNTGAACSSAVRDEIYAFDDAGNRTSATLGGTTTAFSYDATGRLTAAGGSPVTHDSAGRTQTYAGWFYEYDPEGRLIRACKSTSCSGSGFDRVEFTYDGEGHRTRIVATSAAGTVTTTDFRYQGDAVVEEKINGSVAKTFVVDEIGSIVRMTIPSGDNAGDYLVSWNGHGDALHLLRILADGSTELANTFTYSTWGAPTVDGSHDNSANSGADYGDLGFRYLYVGEFDVQWDNAFGLGLLYMHARHYAPALGRFLQPDPDGLEDSLYGYAANNPVTEMDPDGTCFIVCLVVGAVVDTAIYVATTEDATLGGAVEAVARGAIESAINPLAKIGRVSKALTAINRVVNKAPKARKVAQAPRASRPKSPPIRKTGATISQLRQTITAWDRATKRTRAETIRYHYNKHGGSQGVVAYTRSAVNHLQRNAHRGRTHRLKTGVAGIKVSTRTHFGIYTAGGRIVSFGPR